jgi:hypothetical protein
VPTQVLITHRRCHWGIFLHTQHSGIQKCTNLYPTACLNPPSGESERTNSMHLSSWDADSQQQSSNFPRIIIRLKTDGILPFFSTYPCKTRNNDFILAISVLINSIISGFKEQIWAQWSKLNRNPKRIPTLGIPVHSLPRCLIVRHLFPLKFSHKFKNDVRML